MVPEGEKRKVSKEEATWKGALPKAGVQTLLKKV